MPRRMNEDHTENRGKSNIEKWRESADAKEVQTAMTSGAFASHAARTLKRQTNDKLETLMRTEDVPALLQNLLLSDLTEDQKSYVRSIVPADIPTENINILTGWFYACADKGIKTGDTAALEKLLKVAGLSAESIKLDIKQTVLTELDFGSMSDEELMRYADQQIIDVDFDEVNNDGSQ